MDNKIGGKKCSKCEEWKEIEKYYFDASRGRHTARCKKCMNEYYILRYNQNKEHFRNYHQRWLNKGGDENVKKNSRNWINHHYENDENFRIAHLIRTRTSHAVKKWIQTGIISKSTTDRQIDYEAIIEHLGPCPGEYGRGNGKYTIDHIVDLRSWDLSNPIEYAAATYCKNHRWMLFQDNYNRRWEDEDMSEYREYLIKLVNGE